MIPFLLSHLRFSSSLKGDDGSFFGQGRLGDFLLRIIIFLRYRFFRQIERQQNSNNNTSLYILASLFSPSIALPLPLLGLVLPRPLLLCILFYLTSFLLLFSSSDESYDLFSHVRYIVRVRSGMDELGLLTGWSSRTEKPVIRNRMVIIWEVVKVEWTKKARRRGAGGRGGS